MREIKFRAWDGHKMWSFKNREWFILTSNGYCAFDDTAEGSCDVRSNNLDSEEWELMQFTGLLDKQGVEIYEGDVVKLQHVSYPLEVNYSTVRASFIMGKEHCFMPLSDIEVIGNIYQDAESLEK